MSPNTFQELTVSAASHIKTLLIVWHSRTGAAKQMAQAAHQGAQDIIKELEANSNARCVLVNANEATAEHVLQASAYLFCCPENLASMSGAMKEFFDVCYYPVLERISGQPYALMVSAGTDGNGALRQMQRICVGWRLKEAAPPLLIRNGAQTAEAIWAPKNLQQSDLDACYTLGATLAALMV